MDPARQRIQDDLRGLVRGDVRCDELFLQLYASDASIYQIKPLAVVRPRSTADVAACLQARPNAALIVAYGIAFLDRYLKGKGGELLSSRGEGLAAYRFEMK
jgi:hypothetical protein